MNTAFHAWLSVAGMFAAVSQAVAQIPLGTGFTYQGRLLDSGQSVNGPTDMVFRLYDAEAGGNLKGVQAINGVPVTAGVFAVTLNAGGEFGPDAFNGEARWLEILIEGQTLLPRQSITAAPYALKTRGIDGHSLDASDGTPTDAVFVDLIGRVGIGTTVPLSPLTLRSNGAGNGLVHSDGVSAIATYLSGAGAGGGGWLGTITADPLHLFANNSTPRLTIDVTGKAGIGTTSPGMSLEVVAPSYYGGPAVGVSAGANYAYVHAGAGPPSVIWNQPQPMRFGTETSRGAGYVEHMRIGANGNIAIGGLEAGSTRLRVLAPVVPGQTGVFADAGGNNGVGVWGRTSDIGVGVFGAINAQQPDFNLYWGTGVYGRSPNRGVVGQSDFMLGMGVLGVCQAVGGYGVYSTGNMGGSGTKQFRIDHPGDPTNRYLLHYSVESPEVLNCYSGKLVLDEGGGALVELPPYFGQINKDPRYSLTALGEPMPMLHVAEEISDEAMAAASRAAPGETAPACRFRIGGGAPRGRVSWRVEAVRNDLWVRARGAPVEVDKPAPERGRYQHPDLYGTVAAAGGPSSGSSVQGRAATDRVAGSGER